MITLFLFVVLLFSSFMLFASFSRIARVQLAQKTLENIQTMYYGKIISQTQAMVFLRDIQDPLDTGSVLEVNRQLKEIYEKHESTNR